MRQRLMTGRHFRAHLLVAIDFAAPAGDRDELSESAYRIYNTMLFAQELPAEGLAGPIVCLASLASV